jgi:phosphoglycerate-specific signal transduction histidine kinase
MIIGIALGYGINKSITNNAPKIEQSYIQKISKGNIEIKKQISAAVSKIEKDQLKQAKKKVASNFSILSDIFLRLIKNDYCALGTSCISNGCSQGWRL